MNTYFESDIKVINALDVDVSFFMSKDESHYCCMLQREGVFCQVFASENQDYVEALDLAYCWLVLGSGQKYIV